MSKRGITRVGVAAIAAVVIVAVIASAGTYFLLLPPAPAPTTVVTTAPPTTIITTAPPSTVVTTAPPTTIVTTAPTTIVTTALTTVVTTPSAEFKLAEILPGSIQDADFNTLGVLALGTVGDKLGIPTAYSERVAVPDAERVMREYIAMGYNIIWAHGAQFNTAALKLAKEFPDICFIMESDAPLTEDIPNIWNMDRNFQTGFYALGALAALKTKTDKVGYIGGQDLAFATGELNAIKQAVDKYKPGLKVSYVFIGDFNDPLKTRQAAEAMIAEGVDVILGSLNLGTYGLFEAVRAAPREVWVTCKYTDKSGMLPERMMTSYVYDFSAPVIYAVEQTMKGNKAGYTVIEFGKGKGCYIQFPIKNVSEEIATEIQSICDGIEAGTIKVIKELKTKPTF